MSKWLFIIIFLAGACANAPPSSDGGDAGIPDTFLKDTFAPEARPDSRGDFKMSPDAGPPSAWKEVLGQTDLHLRDIWGTGPDNLFAVGKGGVIWHYNGKFWWPHFQNYATDLYGIWGFSRDKVYAVGERPNVWWGKEAVLIRYDGFDWYREATFLLSLCENKDWCQMGGLRKIWGISPEDFWITTENGHVIRRIDNHYWGTQLGWGTPIASQAVTLNGIWGTTDGVVYVVGNAGTIFRNNRQKWAVYFELMPTGVTEDLHNVWGTGENNVYAVGANGTILHFDGTSWKKINFSSLNYYYGLWGSSSNDIYVVGNSIFEPDKSILHWDSVSWQKMPPPNVSDLRAVYGFSSSQVFIVGNYNILQLK